MKLNAQKTVCALKSTETGAFKIEPEDVEGLVLKNHRGTVDLSYLNPRTYKKMYDVMSKWPTGLRIAEVGCGLRGSVWAKVMSDRGVLKNHITLVEPGARSYGEHWGFLGSLIKEEFRPQNLHYIKDNLITLRNEEKFNEYLKVLKAVPEEEREPKYWGMSSFSSYASSENFTIFNEPYDAIFMVRGLYTHGHYPTNGFDGVFSHLVKPGGLVIGIACDCHFEREGANYEGEENQYENFSSRIWVGEGSYYFVAQKKIPVN